MAHFKKNTIKPRSRYKLIVYLLLKLVHLLTLTPAEEQYNLQCCLTKCLDYPLNIWPQNTWTSLDEEDSAHICPIVTLKRHWTWIAHKVGLYSRTSFLYKYETSTLTPFVKPHNILNLAGQNILYLQSYVQSAFMHSLGSTKKGYCPLCTVSIVLALHNTKAYHLGYFEPSYPYTKELHA